MRTVNNLDLSYRPPTYWGEEKQAISNISGTLRRGMLVASLCSGVREIEPELLVDNLEESQRASLGQLNPAFRSGEDLPPMQRQETEIARLTLSKTIHMEVISIRARRVGSRIKYRVANEMLEGMCVYEYKTLPQTSKRPLAFGELVRLIDQTVLFIDGKFSSKGLLEPIWVNSGTTDPNQLQDWVDASSLHYPSLNAWCRCRFQLWAESRLYEEEPLIVPSPTRRRVLDAPLKAPRIKAQD